LSAPAQSQADEETIPTGVLPTHSVPLDDLLAKLAASSSGLSSVEASARSRRHGPNRLPPPWRPSWVAIYLRQFRSPLVYLLLLAAGLSLALDHLGDALFIFAVLQVNALIGATQEGRAQSSAAALDKLVPLRTVALRDDAPREIEASELVPGDVVRLSAGSHGAGRSPSHLGRRSDGR
jgi:P-type Ca2+ transporter type 2C